MLYLVRMDVDIPLDMPKERADAIKAEEREYSQKLQHDGRWPHLWRVVGEYSNYSVFDVAMSCIFTRFINGTASDSKGIVTTTSSEKRRHACAKPATCG